MNETTNYKFSLRAASDTIYCGAESQLENAEVIDVECFTRIENEPILPRGECELEWGESFFVRQNGKASPVYSSDFPFNLRATILRLGGSIKGDGWQCAADESALTRTSRDKHGFKISKQSQGLFQSLKVTRQPLCYLDFDHHFRGMRMAANEFKVSNQENSKEYTKDQAIDDYIKNLRKYNGYTEKDKNITIFGTHYGLQGQFRCGMYVDYVMEESFGKQNARQIIGGFSTRVESSKNNYQKIGGWNDSANYTPRRGDRIFFLLPTKNKTRIVNYTGVVTNVDLKKGTVYTIERDTSVKPRDGSETTVREKQYNLNHPSIKGYGTPNQGIEIKDRLDDLEQSENAKENNSPAGKLQTLVQGLKNGTDGTFATKALAEDPDVMASFRAEQAEALKENRQQRETTQNTPQIQEERSYGGRSFS